ncbi:MAG: SurA N-terminal domain-containing protein [Desulfatibacillaceae bacterium]|nr:SurA N-terminal domain-containing protein [Desulfatibacillaceae bacterium]
MAKANKGLNGFGAKIRLFFRAAFFAALVCVVGPAGCKAPTEKTEPVVCVGQTCMTRQEFNAFFALVASELPAEDLENPVNRRKARLLFLDELVEQMLVAQWAANNAISISPDELDSEIAVIAADYPDNTFKEIFQQTGVAFEVWKESLHRRLLVLRAVERRFWLIGDIQGQIPLAQSQPDSLSKASVWPRAASRTIGVRDLQEEYARWIKELESLYPVKRNTEFL